MGAEMISTSQPKFLRVIATIISYILHPLFIPLYITLVLYKIAPSSFTGVTPQAFGKDIAVIVINTIFFPLLLVLLLKGLGFQKSILMQDPKDRIIPLMGAMVFYFWAYWVFRNTSTPLILRVLFLGSFWNVIAIFMVNIFFKISMHTSAAGAMVGLFIALMLMGTPNILFPFVIVLVVAALIGAARFVLRAHKMGQLWLGYIVGLLVMLAAYGFA